MSISILHLNEKIMRFITGKTHIKRSAIRSCTPIKHQFPGKTHYCLWFVIEHRLPKRRRTHQGEW
jgi:hypothetical protein